MIKRLHGNQIQKEGAISFIRKILQRIQSVIVWKSGTLKSVIVGKSGGLKFVAEEAGRQQKGCQYLARCFWA